MGWVFIVRPGRCVMAEGPVEEVEALLDRALELVAPTVGRVPAPAALSTTRRKVHAA